MAKVLRKEMKYLLPIKNALRLEKYFRGFLELDNHGDHGGYFIRSQYYDSLYNRDLNDNLAGLHGKKKIRLRIYSLSDAMVKLELKSKQGADSAKLTLSISREEALSMEQGDFSFLLDYNNELALHIYLLMMEGCYRPKVLIDYNRLAFFYPAGDVRVTFDRDIRVAPCAYGLFEDNMGLALDMEERVLMEVKYTGFLPETIGNVLMEADTLFTSHSKYSRGGMSVLG